MNDRQLENKVRRDGDRIEKDISNLAGDSAVQLGNLENQVTRAASQTKEGLITWVEDSASKLSDGLEKMTSSAKDTLDKSAAAVKKDVGHGLNRYNTEAQKLANKVPGGFASKITSHPWVAISIGLMFGFLLGGLLKPGRKFTI